MPIDRDILKLARQMRHELAPAEAKLWKRLRDRRFESFKFRRQRPIGRYIVDFFCRECLLIVELDGDSHAGREAADAKRQSELEACGYRVLRFWNHEVFDELEWVLDTIFDACAERKPKKPDST